LPFLAPQEKKRRGAQPASPSWRAEGVFIFPFYCKKEK
jgi:hypothetical protein